MKIIVEGIDGSGKSVLVKRLGELYDLPTVWAGGPPSSDEEAISHCIKQLELDWVICDRVTPISRTCYQTGISQLHRENLLGMLRQMLRDSVIVFCIGQGEESADGHRNDDHDEFVRREFDRIKYAYIELMQNIPHVTYDFKTETAEKLCDRISHLVCINTGV